MTDSSRPSDHYDSTAARPVEDTITQPRLGPVGYLRFFWRQLTSMKTALFLLLLLAIAAIPGSLVPQVSSDPNGVIQFKANNPTIAPVLDTLQVFTTYSSVWFSAIYLLLFVSLIGCVIPRTKHHFDALRARPPKTPANLQRLEGFTTQASPADADVAIAAGQKLLKRQGYRTALYTVNGSPTVSAERGYLRETGNLVFHSALIGVLVAVGLGGGFGYTGQRVVVEGYALSNSLASYDSFNPGRFFTDAALEPYSIGLDSFVPTYDDDLTSSSLGQVLDYTANVTATLGGGEPQEGTIKVNEPLAIGGTSVYLLGNGYAPVVTVRDSDGTVVFSQPTAFLPQDANLFSLGIIKIPDGLKEQIGIRALFYPTAVLTDLGTIASSYPDLVNPQLTMEVYTGDLGLDNGQGTNAYALDTDSLTQIAGRTADSPTIKLGLGDSIDLPNGLGSIELTEIPRFVSLDVHHDPAQGWVLVFAILVLAGLVTSLFIPRRRMWITAVTAADGSVSLEYAGLARGDDPGLTAAVSEIAGKHVDQLGLKVES
ncbi:cytochrome c biogenesis protein [Salinibacterium sp. CAN_S4]|uniref:cytochrome c biogenesis protein ResB n=1 Tax=Salinibacterium sp. CAN_S4 TaxID=2787727 RepID=UPI0018EFA8C3